MHFFMIVWVLGKKIDLPLWNAIKSELKHREKFTLSDYVMWLINIELIDAQKDKTPKNTYPKTSYLHSYTIT